MMRVTDKDGKLILTRSIRRKLAIVLAVVFVMIVLLTAAGLCALNAYHRVVNHMRISQERESRYENLNRAIAGLIDAFVHAPKVLDDDNAVVAHVENFDIYFDNLTWQQQRATVQIELTEYFRIIDPLPSMATLSFPERFKSAKLEHIKYRLGLLDYKLDKFQNADQNLLAAKLLPDVMVLQSLVQQIRSPGSAFDATLKDSDQTIKGLLWLIGGPTFIVIVLFLVLIHWCYHWILIPIRQLHEAASRVANGDYSYRLKLRGKDEMVELAEMFNKMTARFQTDKTRLDQEVGERSRQILRNERLAGIGFFASGIAHEINNPLQAIGNASESLIGRLGDGSLGHELSSEDHELLSTYLGMIERESTRCQQITSRVLDFARGTNGPKTRQDLTKIVAEVIDMVAHMSKFHHYKIDFNRSQPHLADVSAAEMKQVVLNLIANGLESMNGTGTMAIQISETVDEVILSVKDEGCGMTPAVIENLYEPFFTEKQNGKGTGLGLSITHRIVGDHGGRIEATSEGPGCGSTFRVHLPRCAKAVKTSAA